MSTNSMSAQHTPGPWRIANDGKFVYALNEQGYNRFWAHVQGGNTAPMEHTSDNELQANARLIAAAPDLLDALQDVLRNHCAFSDTPSTEVARAAIAKATGSAA